MPIYNAPIRDMQFVMHEVLNVAAELKPMAKFADTDVDTINAFSQNWDKLQVSGMTATTNWTKVQDGAHTVITVLGVNIIVQNTLAADMTNADFIF